MYVCMYIYIYISRPCPALFRGSHLSNTTRLANVLYANHVGTCDDRSLTRRTTHKASEAVLDK